MWNPSRPIRRCWEDLAVVVDEAVTAAQVEDVIRTGGGEYLAKVKLFDIFRGKQVGEGKKSLAFSLTYMAPDRTLTDKEVSKARQKVIFLLGKELNAELRSLGLQDFEVNRKRCHMAPLFSFWSP